MKKVYVLLLVTVLALFTAACGDQSSTSPKSSNETDKLTIYTTVYPLSYFAQRIGGDFVDVSSIYPAGANEKVSMAESIIRFKLPIEGGSTFHLRK
ncbi:hypothetical protein ACQKGQ_20390, partial [Bacillus cereus]